MAKRGDSGGFARHARQALSSRLTALPNIALALSLIALLLPAIFLHSAAASSLTVTTVSTKKYLSGTLADLRVSSPEVDYPMRDIFTWTPPISNQDSSTLPIVYFLHGWPGSPSSMIASVTPQLVKAFQSGAKPFIAAFPDGNAKTHFDSEWADSSDGKAMVETWLTTNAITAVEGSRIRTRSERAIVGFSMGGYGASIIALHHPDLFSQVTTLAGYFLVDDLTGAFKGSAKLNFQNPSNFMSAAKQLRWYLAEAKDDYTQPIHGEMARWSKKLVALKIPVTTHSPTGGHSFIFVGNEALLLTSWLKWPPLPTPSATPAASSTPTAAPTSPEGQPTPPSP